MQRGYPEYFRNRPGGGLSLGSFFKGDILVDDGAMANMGSIKYGIYGYSDSNYRRTFNVHAPRSSTVLKESFRQKLWASSLILPGEPDLKTSLISELAHYLKQDVSHIENLCRNGYQTLAKEWNTLNPTTKEEVEAFYRKTDLYLYDLTWWHALRRDTSALVQVEALEIAISSGAQEILDFGSGIGSLGIVFAKNGFHVTLADINHRLNEYARWRFAQRGISVKIINTNHNTLPENFFDFISAIDVIEHIADPFETLAQLIKAMKPGGILFLNIPQQLDCFHPMHIRQDNDSMLNWFLKNDIGIEQYNGQTMILRKGIKHKYVICNNIEIKREKHNNYVLSDHPFKITRLTSMGSRVITFLRNPQTFSDIASRFPSISLSNILYFLNEGDRLGIIEKVAPLQFVLPKVTIIVPALNRPEKTRACVVSLMNLNFPSENREIIVVDDASDPPLGNFLEGLPISIIRFDQRMGQSTARNVAAGKASGKVLAFIDNDCEADPNWLYDLVPQFWESSVGIVGGRTTSPVLDSILARFEAVRSPLDMGGSNSEVGLGNEVPFLPGCNLLIRKSAFSHIKGFDEKLAVGEDANFVWRANENGIRAKYFTSGKVIHHHRLNLVELLSRRADYGMAEAKMLKGRTGFQRRLDLSMLELFILIAVFSIVIAPNISLALFGLAMTYFLGETLAKLDELKRNEITLDVPKVINSIARKHWGNLYRLSLHSLRYLGFPLVLLAVFSPTLSLGILTILLIAPFTDHLRLSPKINLVVWTGLYLTELFAYQFGVWKGCIKSHTLVPLLPSITIESRFRDLSRA